MGRGDGAPLTASGTARAGRRRAVRFAPEHAPAVRAFNERLAHAGAPWRFPESTVPDWLRRVDGVPVWQEYFLLLEDDAVRGAYVLALQDVRAAHRVVLEQQEVFLPHRDAIDASQPVGDGALGKPPGRSGVRQPLIEGTHRGRVLGGKPHGTAASRARGARRGQGRSVTASHSRVVRAT